MAEHPTVRRELRRLEELLATLDQANDSPGRHRAQAGRMASRGAEPEAGGGSDLKPDPATARTAADYVTLLRQYRAWSGDVPWRKIAAGAKQKRVHSTIYNALRRDDLPTLEVARAIIIGCGGDEDDLSAFTSAWQRISSPAGGGHGEGSGLLPAPVPAFQLQPGT
jgi:hypothetical protein